MVEPHALARADELHLQINRLHVSYLQADESPQKIEQRTKLENYIRKYLCLIAHGRKFIYQETAEILRRSVEIKDNFSAYRASTAWNAIARYAANLVSQPWRKEFSVIKTFSGFYMHDIEENLADAERLLDCMGYKRIDHTSLILEQPIDLDAVISVSRDAIVAFVECQVMKEIWEGVYPQFECSWMEILNFRETHICSPESAIKSLAYHYHQNCFHQQQILASGVPHDPYASTPRFHQSNCVYGQAVSPQMNMAYYGYPSYPSCSVPSQTRYACVVNPQHVMGYPISPVNYHQHAKSPVQLLPANGYHYPHSHHGLLAPSAHNGYAIPQPVATLPQNYGCVVPTGQLIELDNNTTVVPPSHPARMPMPHLEDIKSAEVKSGNGIVGGERVSNLYAESKESLVSVRPDNKSVRPNTLEDLKPRRNGVHADQLSSSAGGDSYSLSVNKHMQRHNAKKMGAPAAPMQDGTGTWESWDYVYRNLESQGYNKDVGERGDILHNSTTIPRRGSTGSAGSSPNINSTLVRNSRIMRDAEVSATLDELPHLAESIQSIRLNSDECANSRGLDAVDSRSAVREKGSTVKDKLGPKGPSGINKTVNRDHKREMEITSLSVPKKVQENNVEDRGSFWECVFCTYHNNTERFVCEMCGKSRQPGNEDKPLISGGRECPKCTLVNARGVVSCVACDESLKNSPTYI